MDRTYQEAHSTLKYMIPVRSKFMAWKGDRWAVQLIFKWMLDALEKEVYR
jgi:hypothetical protein